MIAFAEQYSWLIVALPVLAFVNIAFAIIISGKTQEFARRVAPWILIVCLTAALLISAGALVGTLSRVPAGEGHGHGHALTEFSTWFSSSQDWLQPSPAQVDGYNPALRIGVLLDPLSAVMLVVVVLVSLLVQVYSLGYMKRDEHPRYYLFMALFTASMLGLVISSSLLMMFIFWELVGLCSYLLIGFWFTKPEAARAAIKAFVVTRFGDLGLLIAVIALWMGYGDLSFAHLHQQIAVLGNIHPAALPLPLVVIGILIFFGASGKSAQFPLHIWLPDAMEGPTPVSALIHAATMVAAGVFLVTRMFFLFAAAPAALVVVAVIGVFTALLAATIALVQVDMKKVMAYSTISQLGYMMMGLGLGAPMAAFFHLTTHAFFKALLFLTSGSVIHATETQNMWEMGGLFKKMKVTAVTCLIGGLALAGIPLFAGYFSKHALLEAGLAAMVGQGPKEIVPLLATIILALALFTVLLTAFYTARMWVLVFLGTPRSHGAEHAHEAPFSMRFSLIVLAVLTCVTGLPWIAHNVPQLAALVGETLGAAEHLDLIPKSWLAGLTVASLVLAVGGIFWGARTYLPRPQAEPLRALGGLYTGMVNLWYINAFFVWLAGRVVLALAGIAARFDKGVVDGGLVDGTAWLTGRLGHAIRKYSAGPLPGQLQYYALLIFAIVALIILAISQIGFAR
ncbi:MAG: NADH-quinone oxidoreductase subunit L [Armatimonadota bacterium]